VEQYEVSNEILRSYHGPLDDGNLDIMQNYRQFLVSIEILRSHHGPLDDGNLDITQNYRQLFVWREGGNIPLNLALKSGEAGENAVLF
jgi:hypothetical protein